MDIADLALRAQIAWFRGLAASGFPQSRTRAGFAVSTGLNSNTENGAVITPVALDRPEQLDSLLGWLRERAVPASVIVTEPLDPDMTSLMISRGLQPDNSGNDMGRLLTDLDAVPAQEIVQINEVTDALALRENHRVYADDGWWDEPGELDHLFQVAVRLGFGPGRPIRHWTAYHQQAPVGTSTYFQFDDAVLLAHCWVAKSWRRQGLGTALTQVRLAAAAGGAVQAVHFPSPDGCHLHHSLGFQLVPAHANRWFYLR